MSFSQERRKSGKFIRKTEVQNLSSPAEHQDVNSHRFYTNMGPYILASAIILAAAVVAFAYFTSRGRTVIDTAGKTVEGVSKVAGNTVTQVVQDTTKAAENVIKPISDAVGKIGQAFAERIRTKQTDLDKLRQKVLSLTQELEAQKAKRINIEQVKSILQLALIEIPFDRYHVKQTTIKTESGGQFSRDEELEYLGIFRFEYKQRLGVALDKLEFQLVQPDRIEVSGLGQTENIGAKDIKVDPILTELRRHLLKSKMRPKATEIAYIDPDNLARDKEREQRNEKMPLLRSF